MRMGRRIAKFTIITDAPTVTLTPQTRHTGAPNSPYRRPNRHTDASTVIPIPLPSFRRKPESVVADAITVAAGYNAGFRLAPE